MAGFFMEPIYKFDTGQNITINITLGAPAINHSVDPRWTNYAT
jgi:hypothetical protein